MRAVAAPVRDGFGDVVAALAVSGAHAELDDIERVARQVAAAATELTEQLIAERAVTVLRTDHARVAYDAFAPVYDRFTAGHDQATWTGGILELAEAAGLRGRRVLDVACGTGNAIPPMLARGFEVTGVDISAAMLAHARDKLGAQVDAARRRHARASGARRVRPRLVAV